VIAGAARPTCPTEPSALEQENALDENALEQENAR
jgi:hypothetical protein